MESRCLQLLVSCHAPKENASQNPHLELPFARVAAMQANQFATTSAECQKRVALEAEMYT